MKCELITDSAKLPTRGSKNSAGLDLYADEATIIYPNLRDTISTGVKIQIPDGYYGLIKSRSSLAVKGIDVQAGVVDNDYRGVVKVVLHNTTFKPFTVYKGERIAQIIISPYSTIMPIEGDLDDSKRGEGGFGSTGQ